MKRFAHLCLLGVAVSAIAFGTLQESSFFTLNAGLSKALEPQQPTAVAFSRDGSMLATIDKAGVLTVSNVTTGGTIGKSQAHSGGKAAVAFSPFGDAVASWGQDQKVIVWDAKGSASLKTVATTGGKPGTLAFSGDGTRLAAGGDDGTIRVFDVLDGSQITSYKAHKGAVVAMAFEPAGKTVVSVGADRNMKTGDAATGQILREKFLPPTIKFDSKPEPEFQQIKSASCTPDGSLFAIGGYNWYRQLGGMPREYEFVILFDRTGRRLLRINDPNSMNMSQSVSISPDGKLVMTAAPDGKVRVWDVQHREKAVEVGGHGSVKGTAAGKMGDNYFFAVAGKVASITAVTPTEPDPQPVAGEAPKSVNDGLGIEFATPGESAPIVNAPNVQISALLTGLKGQPKWTIEVAGRASTPQELTASDNRELITARATEPDGKAYAAKLPTGPVQVSQELALSEGPNRIKVTVQDGGRTVTAVKTICYVPAADDLAKDKVYSNSYAVVIGVNQYGAKGSKGIPALKAAVADANDVAALLKSQYGFKDVVLLTDAQATKTAIMKALNRLTDANVVRPNDRVLVFWSGHGQTVTTGDGGQIGFLLPTDAQVDFTNLDNVRPYRESCVPMDELGKLAREIPAKHVLFLVDACFSGIAAAKGNVYPPNTFGLVHQAYFDAKQIITASSRFEPAKEKDGHGYFTKALLDSLADAATDENKDGYVTASELYKALTPKVQVMNNTQSPRMAKFSSGVGEMLFWR